MKFFIAFATTEGQTGKIAKFVADNLLELGHQVSLQDISDYLSGLSLEHFDKVVVAGSVHENRHQDVLRSFIAAHKTALASKKTLFLSVSLSAAFDATSEQAEGYVQGLFEHLDWRPDAYALVAGAIRHGAYGYYQEMIVQHNVLPEGAVEHPEKDHEFTDWASLETAIAEFAET